MKRIDFYQSGDKKRIRPELFLEDAKEIVSKIEEKFAPKSTQVRKFYNQALNHKKKIESSVDAEEAFRKELPYIRMMIAKAVYAESRKNINPEFRSFIEEHVKGIDDYKDFKVFCELFEAVIAYYKK